VTRFATLHEAMVDVLQRHGGQWMARDEIAREIAARDLWRRLSDGRHPPSDQLRLRARQYPHLFEGSDTRYTRIRLRSAPEVATEPMPEPTSRESRGTDQKDCDETSDPMWYEELRSRYRPDPVKVLLIGESPPDPGSGQRRFFYARELTYDNLYRGVAEAIYGLEPEFDVQAKEAVLDRLKEDGFWLVDAVEHPVNKLSRAARRRAIADAVPGSVERCKELAPERGVIICHSLVYELTASALRAAGVRILHDEPIPFPLGNWRAQFVSGVRNALCE